MEPKDLGYELHITLTSTESNFFIQFGNWKFSKIDGDPVLGPGVKCYLTTHTRTFKEAVDTMTRAMTFLDGTADFVVIHRSKIEHIVYDEKY